MKDAVDVIDRLLARLGTLLRYAAPGFAALFVIAWLIPNSHDFFDRDSNVLVVAGSLLGVTIYGLHTNLSLPIIRCLVLSARYKLNDGWKHQNRCLRLRQRRSFAKKTAAQLDLQRWLRRVSDSKDVKAIQDELDKWGAMLNFLYGLSLSMLLIPIAACFFTPPTGRFVAVLLAGAVVFLVTLVSECRISQREMEYSTRFKLSVNRASSKAVDVAKVSSTSVAST